MLEGFAAKTLMDAGPWGLLILVVSMIVTALVTGRLVPRNTVKDNYKILEDRVEAAEKSADTWRQVAETLRETTHEAVANREEQQEQGRTLIRMLESIPRGQGRRGGN